MELGNYRREIDQLDEQLIGLLAARKRLVLGVAEVKAREGLDARQPDRFREVLDRCRNLAEVNDFDPDVAEEIWQTLHEYFVRLEEDELKK